LREEARALTVVPQDWAPYSSLEDAAKVYLRDPDLALDQLRSLVDFPAVKSFIMSRGVTSELWGDALWQEVVLTDGRRLIIWRADDGSTTTVDTELFCESFRYVKTVDNGGLAQMERLLHFGRVLSRSV
jgi:hypothetical protein